MNTRIRRPALISVVICSCGLLSASGCQFGQSRSSPRPGEPALAQQKFDLVKEPDINPETRFAAGQLAESRSDWEMAVKQYESVLKSRPDDTRAMHRLAFCYTMAGKFDRAESAWLTYVQATGRSPDAYNNLAQAYEFAGRPVDAENAYRTAIERDPRHVYARTNYGLMLVRTGRIDEGRAQMAHVLPPAEVHYNVASVLQLQGNKTQARAEYIKALELDPQLSDARKRLASLE